MTPYLPPRTLPAPDFMWTADDARVAAREDDARFQTELDELLTQAVSQTGR